MKASKLLWVLLAVLLAATLVIGCDDGSGDDDKGPVYLGALADWSIVRSSEDSTTPTSAFSITSSNDGGDTVMKLVWKVASQWQAVQMWAPVPASFPIEEYDGLTFDIKHDSVANNCLVVMREQSQANAWEIGNEYSGGDEWVTIKLPFIDAEDAGWGTAFSEADFPEWLVATKDSSNPKLLYLNPMLNGGVEGNIADNSYTTYFKNIGFYKGEPDNPTAILIIWKF